MALTATMMIAELIVGYAAGSMALLADGGHMATHVAALGISSAAYVLSRRLSTHRAFTFGTGKIHPLAGYTSALLLGLVALAMVVESAARLGSPRVIDVRQSLPVAVIGLLVNLISIRLLHHDHDHDHHDHNHRAALMHVMADLLTSALAILALLAAWLGGVTWLDPLTGVIGGAVILAWSVDLARGASRELLDVDPALELSRSIREVLEADDDVRVSDLHVWSLGRGGRSCVVTVEATSPREARDYRARLLSVCRLDHLTIEVRRREPRGDRRNLRNVARAEAVEP